VGDLWSDDREVVVVTCGDRGCWWLDRGDVTIPRHLPAYPVTVADTTGCGDVFHGAYASALARGAGVAERLRFASAAAAIKATRLGGQAGIPSRDEVERFQKEHAR
jgi:sulfofructose kinase